MHTFPGWSAPLFGGASGALAGLAILGDPRVAVPAAYPILGGAVVGAVAGLIVWASDRGSNQKEQLDSNSKLGTGVRPSRIQGFWFMLAGVLLLAMNHALVMLATRKFFPLVFAEGFFLLVGAAAVIVPRILLPKADRVSLRWHENLIGGAGAIGGLAFGMCLWLVVY